MLLLALTISVMICSRGYSLRTAMEPASSVQLLGLIHRGVSGAIPTAWSLDTRAIAMGTLIKLAGLAGGRLPCQRRHSRWRLQTVTRTWAGLPVCPTMGAKKPDRAVS